MPIGKVSPNSLMLNPNILFALEIKKSVYLKKNNKPIFQIIAKSIAKNGPCFETFSLFLSANMPVIYATNIEASINTI